MPYLHPDLFDEGLDVVAGSNRVLHICDTEPTTYTEASSTYTIGNKSAPTISAPTNEGTGRKVTISAITDGTVTANDTATHFAIVDTGTSRLLCVQALASSVAVVTSLDFSLTEFDIIYPQPV